MPAFPITDSRRQTGAGRLLDTPGAALEAHVPPELHARAEALWRAEARALCDAVGWDGAELQAVPFSSGLSLAVAAPIDALYTATELNEAAWRAAAAELAGEPPTPRDETLAALMRELHQEQDPALVALDAACQAHGVSLLWDDEFATVGMGAGGHSHPADAVPDADAVDWPARHDVPVALVTGTNGKSTTTRMLAAMCDAAGHTTGVSTTDYVAVGGETVERGDFSGPMGARAALRHPSPTAAVLECARGGLLRRGVPVPHATAAAVTNVAADHLGDYGVETVADLAQAKFVVARALVATEHRAGGLLVANADDATSVAEVARLAPRLARDGVRVGWTGLESTGPDGAPLVATVQGGAFVLRQDDGTWAEILPVDEAPATLGGTARYNVRNALTALALGRALGLPGDALAAGLRAFRGDATDNPGRMNRFAYPTGGGTATVVVDYAHNAHGLAALLDAMAHQPAERRLLMLSTAGDRSDADMEALAETAAGYADRYLVPDLPAHLRGRAPGEIPGVFRDAFARHAVTGDAFATAPDSPSAIRQALDWVRPGDLAVLVVLSKRDETLSLLHDAGATPIS